jgi:hypothetical protein
METNNEFKVEGIKEIMEALTILPAEMQARILSSALLKTGRECIVKPLKSALNYSAESEKGIKVSKIRNNKLAVKAGLSNAAYKIRWADGGTEERKTKKGQSRGKIDGKHQIGPIIERQIEPTVKYIEKEMGVEIDKILKRRLKKLNKSL